MHNDLAERNWGAALLYRTASALQLPRTLNVTLTLAAQAAIAQQLTLGAPKNILAGVVLGLVAGETLLRLMPRIDDGDVRLNFLFQQSGQKLPAPVALVGPQALGADAEAFLYLLQHAPSCQGLLPEARRRSFYA